LPAFWKNVPPVHPLPRTGDFGITPTTPGAFTLLDALLGVDRQTPPKYPYPSFSLMQQPFFDFSWAYLDDPKLDDSERDLFDFMKRVHIGDDFLFGTGGQVWWRSMNEQNSRLSGIKNHYDLFRLRTYADFWYRDCVRVYAEFITAQTYNQDLNPLPIDRNYADLLNAFVEFKVADINGKNAYVRAGRQELVFGSQRLISALDWANTRRTFQGVRGYRVGDKWDVDLFWVQPVIPNARKFDSVDNNINFAGAWVTHRPKKGTAFDFYYLFLDNTSRTTVQGINSGPYNVHTLGSRGAGNEGSFLYDYEGMIQLGDRVGQSTFAGSASAGIGWDFKELPLKPVLWAYYDYASGDDNPNSGSYSTFNQLFPFGHFYLGWLDLVGRQNITDANAHLFLYPANWITLWLQYHHFELASSRDALYNAAGVATRRSPNGTAGRSVGDEIDVVCNFQLDNHSSLLVGWSYLFAGDFIRNTARNHEQGVSPSLWYLMYSFRW